MMEVSGIIRNELKWTTDLEVALFHSMHSHKPVGLNKHFHMVCIQHKLQQSTGLPVSTEQIWAHLRTLYDIDSLDDMEKFPFSKEYQEFTLPETLNPLSSDKSSEVTDAEIPAGLLQQSSSPSPVGSPLMSSYSTKSSKRKT